MKRQVLLATALAGSALPTPAYASTATFRIFATIPVACAIDIVDTHVAAHSVIVLLHRECNAAHDITVAGQYAPELGDVSLTLGGQQRDGIGNYASIAQPEGYYESTEELVLSPEKGSTEDLIRYATSLSIGVETR